MKNLRSIVAGLRYHQIAHTLILGSLLATAFLAEDWLASVFNISLIEVEVEPDSDQSGLRGIVLLISWIGGYWWAWTRIKKGKVWWGIILGLIATALPAFGSIDVLAMFGNEGLGLDSLGCLVVILALAFLLGGMFVHYLALLLIHWAAKAETAA